ncbi:hypothetical protein J3459_016636 [Metarhizium acridum]|nr:hypothetical protein J3459_016636 [Metarhizium acridum]
MLCSSTSEESDNQNLLQQNCVESGFGEKEQQDVASPYPLGRKFDAINYSWQPPERFHEEVYKRYWDLTRAQGALKWYADSRFTKELPQDIELLMHTPHVWSEHRLHVVHCLYDWELMHYALSMNKPVPEFISRLNHTMHCVDTALDQNYRVKDTVIKASHNRCVMLAQVKVG